MSNQTPEPKIRASLLALLLAIIVAAFIVPTRQSYGATLASESFEYPNGALAGQNGGTGWADAWSGGDTRNLVNSPGMDYSDGTYNLTTAGGYVGIGGFNDGTFRTLSQTGEQPVHFRRPGGTQLEFPI